MSGFGVADMTADELTMFRHRTRRLVAQIDADPGSVIISSGTVAQYLEAVVELAAKVERIEKLAQRFEDSADNPIAGPVAQAFALEIRRALQGA